MVKAFKRTFRYLIYEIIILGVLYDAILAFHLIGRNTSGVLFLSLIVALFVGQWGYFYWRQNV